MGARRAPGSITHEVPDAPKELEANAVGVTLVAAQQVRPDDAVSVAVSNPIWDRGGGDFRGHIRLFAARVGLGDTVVLGD